MKTILKKKIIALDLTLIILAITGISFGATWIYSNVINIHGVNIQLTLTGSIPQGNATLGTPFTLTAYLTFDGVGTSGKTIMFYEDDISIGTSITNATGYAVFDWTVKAGDHAYKAGYEVV